MRQSLTVRLRDAPFRSQHTVNEFTVALDPRSRKPLLEIPKLLFIVGSGTVEYGYAQQTGKQHQSSAPQPNDRGTIRRPRSHCTIASQSGWTPPRGSAKLLIPLNGEMSEWLKEHAWKACVGETLPRVRIPLSPPIHFRRFSSAFCTNLEDSLALTLRFTLASNC